VLDCRALISPEIFRERQMVSLTPFIRETHIHHIRMMRCCCFKVSLFYRLPTEVARFDHDDSSFSRLFGQKKKNRSSGKDFFRVVFQTCCCCVSAVINRLGKFFFLGSTQQQGTKRNPLLFMSFDANSNEFEFPERRWRKRSHGHNTHTHTHNPTATC
jgi:hypothetical protein